MTQTCRACGWSWSYLSSGIWEHQCPACDTPIAPPAPLGPSPRTQKGLGVRVLGEIYPSNMLQVHGLVQEEAHLAGQPYPCFARPCPSLPKHGYIDSRVVESEQKAKALLKQVLADDPGGEIMLCGFVKAAYNMLWTPGSLVVGRGHDGATAGKKTISIPLAGGLPAELTPDRLLRAQVATQQWPFVEAVWKRGFKSSSNLPSVDSRIVLTQLRAGPKIDVKGDYIPTSCEVLKVIKADPAKFKDRDWELLIESVAGEEGVVVWHPGGAMTDHFSIHSFTHGIPVLFGEEPKLGDFLQAEEGHAELKFDPSAMLRGLLAGEKFKLSLGNGRETNTIRSAVSAMLLALHNATACTGEASKWVGFGAAIMLRLGVTALAGESRHLGIGKGPKQGREQVYQKVLNFSLRRQRSRVNNLVNLFRYGEWPSSGFGGAKWANCGGATVALFETVRGLAKNPSPESAAGVVRALNVAVNQAHNGGWWMNKFAAQAAFDKIQKADILWILHATPALYVAGRIADSLSSADVATFAETVSKWPETTLKPPKVESVQMIYQTGSESVGLKIKSRLLGSRGKSIYASIGEVLKAEEIASKVIEHTFIVETEDGYRVEVRAPKHEPVVIWQDPSLAAAARAAQIQEQE